MRVILSSILIFALSQSDITEDSLHAKLKQLYSTRAYQWIIAKHYYEMARFYSKNLSADKSFILLTQAYLLGYDNLHEITNSNDFNSLRRLKYWEYYNRINRPTENFTIKASYKNKNSDSRITLHPKILHVILNDINNPQRLKLINKYKETILIKSYSNGMRSLYDISYQFDSANGSFIRFKLEQYAVTGDMIYELHEQGKRSVYYFFYKDKSWAVEYKEVNGIIDWRLL